MIYKETLNECVVGDINVICTFCGSTIPDNSKFCERCGNNLQAQTPYLDKSQAQQQSNQNNVEYKQVDFTVQQKILSLRPVYTIKDSTDNVFMIVKRNFFNFFIPHLYVKGPDGRPIGDIQGSLFRTNWKITDPQGNVHATIKMPFWAFLMKHFDMQTPTGNFKSGDSFFGYKFDCYDSQNQVAWIVDKKILSLRDTFQIKSFGMLSPFVTTMSAICIDQRFFKSGGFLNGFGGIFGFFMRNEGI